MPPSALVRDAALLVIDVQQGLDAPHLGARSTPEAEANVARLLAAWRAASRPVLHAQHLSTEPDSPLRPERPGCAIKPEAAPAAGEPVFQKHANSAFVGTDLRAHLGAQGIAALVIAGLTSDHCVSATARTASDTGFAVVVVADATAAHERTGHDGRRFSADDVHAVSLATLHGEFATVMPTDAVLAALAAP